MDLTNTAKRSSLPRRTGLRLGRTGVPLFLLFSTERKSKSYYPVFSESQVHERIRDCQDSVLQKGLESMLPFFSTGGRDAWVLECPLGSWDLESVFSYERGRGVRAAEELEGSFDLLCIPQLSFAFPTEKRRAAYQETRNWIQKFENVVWLLDLPRDLSRETAEDWVESFGGEKMSAFYPWVFQGDQCVPPSGFVAGFLQKCDLKYGLRESPSQKRILPTNSWLPVEKINVRDAGHGRLNILSVSRQRGVVLLTDRTCELNGPYEKLSIARTLMAIKNGLEEIAEGFVFGPFQENLIQKIEITIESFLSAQKKIFEPGARKSYSIRCSQIDEQGSVGVQIACSFQFPYVSEKVEFVTGVSA